MQLLPETDGFRIEERSDVGERTANTQAVHVYIYMTEHKETRFLEAVKNPRNPNYKVNFLLFKRNCNKSRSCSPGK